MSESQIQKELAKQKKQSRKRKLKNEVSEEEGFDSEEDQDQDHKGQPIGKRTKKGGLYVASSTLDQVYANSDKDMQKLIDTKLIAARTEDGKALLKIVPCKDSWGD